MNGNWLTPEEAAELVQVPLTQVQEWMDQERIPFFKFYEGTEIRIPVSGFLMAVFRIEEMAAEREADGEG